MQVTLLLLNIGSTVQADAAGMEPKVSLVWQTFLEAVRESSLFFLGKESDNGTIFGQSLETMMETMASRSLLQEALLYHLGRWGGEGGADLLAEYF